MEMKMDEIAKLSKKERELLFRETASIKGVAPEIVEKDFWVCWTLKQLFSLPSIKEHIVFKGGTTLSKVFGVIERFSEDIDLIMDWRLIGLDKEPYIHRTRTQQERFNEKTNEEAAEYIKNSILPLLDNVLPCKCKNISVSLHNDNKWGLNVKCEEVFRENYIRPEVLLEIDPLGSWIPNDEYKIKPYCAEIFPDKFKLNECIVRAVKIERTFWEKITILHQEAHRSDKKNISARYSRHYYDVFRMKLLGIEKTAFKDIGLLDSVRVFKQKFYPCSWAKYENAKPGTMKLLPFSNKHLKELRDDYSRMKVMIFGEYPKFDAVIQEMKVLEDEINNLKSK